MLSTVFFEELLRRLVVASVSPVAEPSASERVKDALDKRKGD